MNSKRKTDSYKLYSCTHLSRAKINLKVDKNELGNQKRVTYISKPNPSLTINSANGQTTVFLPPSRSLLKSNGLKNKSNSRLPYTESIKYDPFPVDSPRLEMDNPQTFSFGSSEFDDFDLSNEAPSRYKPNILKTKSAKVQISAFKTPKANNKDLVKAKSSHKRKQTYNLSKIDEDVILHEPKRMKENETKFLKKCQQKKAGKRIQIIKKKEKDSCARVCPYLLAFDKSPASQKKYDLLETLNTEIFREAFPNSEYQAENEESFEETFEELSAEVPVNSEFFVPDYLDYLSTSDSISDSDEVHKLLSPSLNIDVLDMFTFPSLETEIKDINGNALKPISSLAELDEECKNFILENNRLKGYMNSVIFQNNFDDKESSSFRGENVNQSPVYVPHFGAKDTLINGFEPAAVFSSKKVQDFQSSGLDFSPLSEESKARKPQVIVEFNKFFLSCAHVECYDQRETMESCDLHDYVKDQVPVSPKTLMPVEEAEREEIRREYLDNGIKSMEEVKFERYQCPDCDIIFGKKRSLALHRNKAHSGFYSYTCTRCAMLCNSKTHLQRHTQSCNSIKKALVCFVCQKRYSYKSSLKQHLKNKHGVLQE
ncbi:uncharacterized protein LOC117181791 [Belonocnema kinseyi]|uniref:uncharacterized protein LOC117181791 n=1 Tax=Belonocnema kinseyi TaxID=2817044 RepID=UPI00143D399D|nr:uncharacterized protein LOC117181791 [Belonocnema kinseyi]